MNAAVAIVLVVSLLFCVTTATTALSYPSHTYEISDAAGPARTFDGIGGLSGGGATSVLLWTYPEPQRSQILDYLFSPTFGGANLQILKVEIGGDAQSTDGSEASIMHDAFNENDRVGYEWWLMQEAKKRNPDIKLYGLAWAYPQWVSCTPDAGNGFVNCSDSPYTWPQQTATYITKWISAAKIVYGLDIDYVGIWNERQYSAKYIVVLRETLDKAGFDKTLIVAPDGDAFGTFAQDVASDAALRRAVWALGAHYPGTESSNVARKLNKPLWASEDDSTYNNAVGSECWARIINQNYVNGDMTASIVWNLIAAYPKGTNWYRASIMNAMQPWTPSFGTWYKDGTWSAGPMVWVTAHTTQFTRADGNWSYLANQLTGSSTTGAGHLKLGGSYVTIKNFKTGDFTIVVEKMSRDRSSCVRPGLPAYDTDPETVTFKLAGNMLLKGAEQVTSLHLWRTHFAFYPGDETREFESLGSIPVGQDGTVTFNVTVESLYTLTTISGGKKGAIAKIPPMPTLFPEPHSDDFEDCRISGEARYFFDQNGIFECVDSGDSQHGVVMQQQVPRRPITWGGDIRPHSLLGHRDGMNQTLSVEAYVTEPSASVMLGVRMQNTDDSVGIIFAVQSAANSTTSANWGLWNSISSVSNASITGGVLPSAATIRAGEWHNYTISVVGSRLNVWIDSTFKVVNNYDVSAWTQSGFSMIGTKHYGEYTQYDNLKLDTVFYKPQPNPRVGSPICNVECSSEVGVVPSSTWTFTAVPNALPKPSTSFVQEIVAKMQQRKQQYQSYDNRNIKSAEQPTLSAEEERMIQEAFRFPITDNTTGVSTISSPSFPNLCISARSSASGVWWLELAKCNSNDPYQQFAWYLDGIAPDGERQSVIYLPAFGRCIDIYQQRADIGTPVDVWPCNFGTNQAFFYDFDSGEVANEWSATCLGVC